MIKSIFTMLFALLMATSCNSASNSSSSKDGESQQIGAVNHISEQQFKTMMDSDSTLLIDVRTSEEINQGYIEGADIFIDINSNDFQEKINTLDKSKTYLVYCRSGSRSSRASDIMVQEGFNKVYNLKGGISGYTGEITKD